jgi:hypothetical protein
MIRFSILLLGLLMMACDDSKAPIPTKSTVAFTSTVIGEITDDRVPEISGLVLSHRSDDVLWVLNDSGDKAFIYALKTNGDFISAVKVKDADNIDWEDLASFEMDGEPYLLIGDIGANVSDADMFSLYLIKEPELTDEKVDLERRIDFRYNDGPRDCEALAVDPIRGKILLLSKRDEPARLYEIDLRSNLKVQTAYFQGEISSIPQPTKDEVKSSLDKYHAQPTALDILPNRKIAVLTYRRLFAYDILSQQSYIEAMNDSSRAIVEYPSLKQAEAMCFDFDGRSILITTEDLPAEILKISFE